MTINPIHIHCGQSECEVCMMPSQPFCICCNTHLLLQTIPSFLIEWPPYKVRLGADGKGVYREGSQVLESSSIGLSLSSVASDADIVKRR